MRLVTAYKAFAYVSARRVQPTSTYEDRNATYSRECFTPNDILNDKDLFLNHLPINLPTVIAEIKREIEELRALGLIKPFVEGEAIGKYVRVRRPKPKPEDIARYHAKKREWQRAEMLALRAKNDRDMESLLTRIG